MKNFLDSIRSTIADMSRSKRWLFAGCVTLVHVVIVTFVTSVQTPIPTLLAIILYAMLVMYLTGTWRKAHVWAPSILLLLCVYPFLATITVTISELVATNIAMRNVKAPDQTAGGETKAKKPKPKAGLNREQRRRNRRHS